MMRRGLGLRSGGALQLAVSALLLLLSAAAIAHALENFANEDPEKRCTFPDFPYASWDGSECPRANEPWSEENKDRDCALTCLAADQKVYWFCDRETGWATMREESRPCPPDGKELYTGNWVDAYGPCSATCGKGIQPFAPYCDTGDEKDCDPEAKPDGLSLSCTAAVSCEYTGTWVPGALRTCSTYECGQTGTALRLFMCSTGNDADCDPRTKPIGVFEPCTASCYGTWVVSYGACTGSPGQTCGRASVPFTITCNTGNEADCDPNDKPFPSYPMCTLGPCSSYSGSWVVSYGACSVTCGTGIQTPIVSCSTGNVADCDPSIQFKLAAQQCTMPACPPAPASCFMPSMAGVLESSCPVAGEKMAHGSGCGVTCTDGERYEVTCSNGVVDPYSPCTGGVAVWVEHREPCPAPCGQPGVQRVWFECSSANVFECESAQPKEFTVDCKGVCGECRSPPIPGASFEGGNCPKEGQAWDEQLVKDGCAVMCLQPEGQEIRLRCEGGLVSVAPDSKPCAAVEWLVTYPACSVTCGSGWRFPELRCSTGNDEDCKYIEQPDAAVEPCTLPACVVAYTGTWVAVLDPCSATVCGAPGTQKRWFRCSTGTHTDCDPATRSQSAVVDCTGPCSTECLTPAVPFADWEGSVCPKEGGTWSEQLVKDGRCTVRCHQPVGQQVILVCSGGKVVVDPKTPPCAAAAFWEVGYGACSVTCGSGYVPVHFRCSTGNDEDCRLIEKPAVAISTCELPACVAKLYPGVWQVIYDPCSATVCGETGKRKKWFRCSTGTYADCDPALDHNSLDVACKGACPCTTPAVGGVNWDSSECPREGDKWSAEIAERGQCTAQCHLPKDQQIVLRCEGGEVSVDPESKPCDPFATWEVEHGACSVTCGSGFRAFNYRCSTGNDDDCESIEKPAVAAVPCDLPACAAWYSGVWQVLYEPCSVTKCGETGWQKMWFKCSTGNDANCDPNADHNARDVACNGACPCLTPDDPFITWDESDCSRPGEAWPDVYVDKGSCTVTCRYFSEQPPRYHCVEGVVTLDPETPPCGPAGEWEVSHGPCSVGCGTGTQPTIVTCNTGHEEECDPRTKPDDSPRACSNGPCSFKGNWVSVDEACNSKTCGEAGMAKRMFHCSTGNDGDCDPTKRPIDYDVECTPACPADCQTPVTPYVNWEASGCPKPGEAWKEEMVSKGCQLECANNGQQVPLQCKEGVVSPVDPDVKPCLPAQWEPDDGPCSASCGGGTLTRNWYCASDSKRDEDCDSEERPEPSEQTCATNHCYGWVLGTWTSCSPGCGAGGTQTRTNQCKDFTTGLPVADGFCGSALPTSQVCAVPHCFTWQTDPFSGCSASCGLGSTATRNVWCRDEQLGSMVVNGNCNAGTKPTTTQSCTVPNCVSWHTTAWTGCGPVCGAGGTETRTVQCWDDTTNSGPLTDSDCASAGPKPASSQACAIPHCYAWQTPAFSGCAPSCGSAGTETRAVACLDVTASSAVVADGNCAGAKPASSQSCPIPHCYAWESLGFGACGPSCGASGSQTQTVQCRDTTSNVVATDADCAAAGPKPLTTQTCPVPHCFSWVSDPWQSCGPACGPAGLRTRTVWCRDDQLGTSVGDANCDAPSRPIDSEACAVPHCFSWHTSAFAGCAPSCGASATETRTVQCYDDTTGLLAASETSCTAPKPADTQACSVPHCFSWHASGFGTCGPACGAAGTQTQSVVCRDDTLNDGLTVADSNCVAGSKPATTQSCVIPHCYGWTNTPWGSCTDVCGPSSRTRVVSCWDSTATLAVADSNCPSDGSRPADSEPCSNSNCYAWKAEPWGTCSASCGPGTASRTYTCVDNTNSGAVVANSYCEGFAPAGAAPITSQDCQIDNCYAWQSGAWGACSITCSTGSQSRSTWCQDTTNNVPAASAASCTGAAPDATQSCYTACTNTFLATLSISDAIAGTFTFDKNVHDYPGAEVPFASSATSALATTEEPTSVIEWHVQSLSDLAYPVTQRISLTVTAQSGASRTYTVDVLRRPSNIAALSALTPSTGAFSAIFSGGVFSYSLSLPNEQTSVGFTATLADPTGSITSWSPSDALSALPVFPATTTLTVTTLAQDGLTAASYTVVVTRATSSVNQLLGFLVVPASTARMLPLFAPGTTVYQIGAKLGPSIASLRVTATPVDPLCTMSVSINGGAGQALPAGTGVDVGPVAEGHGIVSVTSTAQDGSQAVYTCTFYKVSSKALLAGLGLSGGGAVSPGFDPTVLEYTVAVPHSQSSIVLTPTLAPGASGTYSFGGSSNVLFQSGQDLPAMALDRPGDFAVDLAIKSEDLGASKVYRVTIHRASNAASLAALSSSQADFTEAFAALAPAERYTINLGNEVQHFDLSAAPGYALATLELAVGPEGSYVAMPAGTVVRAVDALGEGDTEVRVRVTSEDKSASLVVLVVVHRLSSSSALLSVAPSSGPAVALEPGQLSYTTTVGSHVSVLSVLATPVSAFASLSYSFSAGPWVALPGPGGSRAIQGLSLVPGVNTLLLRVVSEDALESSTYTFAIRHSSASATLRALVVSSPSTAAALYSAPAFDPDTLAYAVTVAQPESSVRITSATSAAGATQAYAWSLLPSEYAEASYVDFTTSTPEIPLVEGTNYLFVRVTSEDTGDSSEPRYYTVAVRRRSAFSLLASLGASVEGMAPPFDASTLEYSLGVSAKTDLLSVFFRTHSPAASVQRGLEGASLAPLSVSPSGEGSLSMNLQVGSNRLALVVAAEDGSSQSVYRVLVYRVSDDSSLASLSISQGKVFPAFNASLHSYTAQLASGVEVATLVAVPTNAGARMTFSVAGGSFLPLAASGAEVALAPGDTLVQVCVRAEDGSAKITSLVLTRASSDAGIAGFTSAPAAESLSPESWSATTLSYRASYPPETLSTTVTLALSSARSRATWSVHTGAAEVQLYTGAFPVALVTGDNVLRVRVVSQDGSATNEYVIVLHRVSSLDTLVSLRPSVGAFVPAFRPDVHVEARYALVLPSGHSNFSMVAVAADAHATVSVGLSAGSTGMPAAESFVAVVSGASTAPLAVPVGDSLAVVRVLAEDGVSARVYHVSVRRLSGDSSLASLVSNAGAMSEEQPGRFAQHVSANTGSVSFTPTPRSDRASCSYASLAGSAASAAEASLSANFRPVSACHEVPPMLLAVGPNLWLLRVGSEDGSSVTVYSVAVQRTSNDASLASLALVPGPSSFLFDPVRTDYEQVTVESSVEAVRFAAVARSPTARSVSYTWRGGAPQAFAAGETSPELSLATGANVLAVTVLAEDGVTSLTYSVTLQRLSSSSGLASMALSPAVGGFAFHADTSEYSLEVPSTLGSLRVTAGAASPLSRMYLTHGAEGLAQGSPVLLQSLAPSGEIALVPGVTRVVLRVLAEDGASESRFTLLIRRPSDECGLAALATVPAGFGFAPAFAPGARSGAYTTEVAHSVSTISFRVVTSHAGAVAALKDASGTALHALSSGVSGEAVPLAVGKSEYTVEVTAENGAVCTYSLGVSRLSNSVAVLGLHVDGLAAGDVVASLDGLLSPSFDAKVAAYSLNVTTATSALSLRVETADATATLSYSVETAASRARALATGVVPVPAWVPLASSTSSPAISMAPGENYLVLRVTSGDRSATAVYAMTVSRASDLSGLALASAAELQVPVVLSPAFAAGVATYRAEVPFGVEALCATATFATAHAGWALLSTDAAGASSAAGLVSNTCSAAVALTVGEQVLTVRDPVDGVDIEVVVLRRGPVLSGVSWSVSSGAALFRAPNPSFHPSVRSYRASLGFLSAQVGMLAVFGEGSANARVAEAPSAAVFSGTQVSLELVPGETVVTLSHSLDGSYRFVFVRAQPDLTRVALRGQGVDGMGAEALLLSAPFQAGAVRSYTATVPAQVRGLAFTAVFATPDSARLSQPGSGTSAALQSGSASAAVALLPGLNSFVVSSVLDGTYRFDVVRGNASVAGLSFTAVMWDGTVANLPLLSLPSFVPGSVVPRAIQVPKSVFSVQVTASFVAGSATLRLASGQLASLALASGVASAPVALDVGANALAVSSSTDGSYAYTITRGARDLTALAVLAAQLDGGAARAVPFVEGAFVPETSAYTVHVPFRTSVVRISAAFSTSSSVHLSGASVPRVALASGAESGEIALVVGRQVLTVSSGVDGDWTVTIVRASPDLASVGLSLEGTAAWLVAPLSFDSVQNTYQAEVPYLAAKVSFIARFATASSVTLGAEGAVVGLVSGAARSMPLAVGSNTFVLTSASDGTYTYTVTRRGVDVSAIALDGFNATGVPLLEPAVPASLSPVFAPAVAGFEYGITVGSNVRTVSLRVNFANARGVNVVSVASSVADVVPVVLASGVSSASLSLAGAGSVTTFTVRSALDGVFTVRVSSMAQVVVGISGADGAAASGSAAAGLALSPSFAPGRSAYAMSAPFLASSLALTLSHRSVPGESLSVQVGSQTFHPATSTSSGPGEVQLSTTVFPPIDLALGVNELVVRSAFDAPYTLTVTRSGADLLSLQVRGNTLQVGGAPVVLTSALVPIFSSTVRSYELAVDFAVTSLRFSAFFATPGSVSVTGSSGAAAETLVSNAYSSPLPLAVGAQTLLLRSGLDGEYKILVRRAAPDLAGIEVQSLPQSCALDTPSSPCQAAPAALSPVFSGAGMSYRVAVPHVAGRVRFSARTIAPGSVVALLDNSTAVLASLPSGSWSGWEALKEASSLLAPGASAVASTTRYYISSPRDGGYSLSVERAYPDLQALRLWVDGVACAAAPGSSALLNRELVAFEPGVAKTYTARVPFAATSLGMAASFGNQWAANTVSMAVLPAAAGASRVPLRSGQVRAGLPLALGENRFTFVSAADGVFEVVVVRAAPAVSGVALRGTASGGVSASFPLAPSFVPGLQAYRAAIPAAVTHVSWSVDSSDSSDELVWVNMASPAVQERAAAGASSTSASVAVASAGGALQFQLRSKQDGCYTFTLAHSPAASLAGLILAHKASFGPLVRAGAAALAPAARASSAEVSAKFQGALAHLLEGDVNASATEDREEVEVHVALEPSFIGGWLGPYEGRVPASAESVRLNMAFAAGLDAASAPSCTLNGAAVRLASQLYPQCAPGASASLSGECGTVLALLRGPNRLACATTDGTYFVTLTRGTGSFAPMRLPETVYAGETIRGLELRPILDGSEPQDLAVAMLASAGSVQPASWRFGSVTSSAAQFALVLPEAVEEPTPLFVSFVPTGGDSWSFPGVGAIQRTTVLPRAALQLAGLDSEGYFSGTQIRSPLLLSLSEAPNRGKNLLVTVQIVSASGELTEVAALEYTFQSAQAQEISFTAPSVSVVTALSLRVVVSGSDAAHYAPLPDQGFTVLPQSSFVLRGLAPAGIRVSRVAHLELAPVQAPTEDALVRVTLVGPGTLALPAVVLEQELPLEEAAQAGVEVATVLTVVELHFPAGSSDAQLFSYTAPSTLPVGQEFTLSFEVVGEGARSFLPIPSYPCRVLRPLAVLVDSLPAAIANRESSGPVRVALEGPPEGELLVVLRSAMDGVTFSPPELLFTAEGQLSQTVVIHAPHFFPRVKAAASSALAVEQAIAEEEVADPFDMAISLVLSGEDSGAFAAPLSSALKVRVAQQAPVVHGVAFLALGSDGRVLQLSPGLSPFQGGKFDYKYDLAVAVMDPSAAKASSASNGAKRTQSHGAVANEMWTSLAASSASASASNTAGPTYNGVSNAIVANLSVALYPTFEQGSLTLIVTYSSSSDSSVAGTTLEFPLTSGVLTPWIRLAPGAQSFALVSSLDGTYDFNFTHTTVVNPSACMAQANVTSAATGVPTESFLSSGADLPSSVLPVVSQDASAPPVLICATMSNLAAAAAQKLSVVPSDSGTLSFALSSSAATSWMWLLALAGYFALSMASGLNIGQRQAMEEEAAEGGRTALTAIAARFKADSAAATPASKKDAFGLSSAAAPEHSASSSAESNTGSKSGSSGSERSSVDGSPSASGELSPKPSANAVAPAISPLFNVFKSVRNSGGDALSALLPAALSQAPRFRFRLAPLMLALCAARAVDMMIYYYFFEKMSSSAVRMLAGLPHVLVPWILTGVMQALPQLLHVTSAQGRNMGVASVLRHTPLRVAAALGLMTLLAVILYCFVLGAQPAAELANMIDLLILVSVAVITLGQCLYLLTQTALLMRYTPQLSAAAGPVVPGPAWSRARVRAAGGDPELDGLSLRLKGAVTPAQVSQSRRALRAMIAMLVLLSAAALALILSVTWSNMYSEAHQSYVLIFTALECAALALLAYVAHLDVVAQRGHLQHFTDVGLEAQVEAQTNSAVTGSPVHHADAAGVSSRASGGGSKKKRTLKSSGSGAGAGDSVVSSSGTITSGIVMPSPRGGALLSSAPSSPATTRPGHAGSPVAHPLSPAFMSFEHEGEGAQPSFPAAVEAIELGQPALPLALAAAAASSTDSGASITTARPVSVARPGSASMAAQIRMRAIRANTLAKLGAAAAAPAATVGSPTSASTRKMIMPLPLAAAGETTASTSGETGVPQPSSTSPPTPQRLSPVPRLLAQPQQE